MKKFLVTMSLLFALVVTMFPTTTTYAVAQTVTSMPTVECSWWGKMVNGDYYKGEEGKRRLQEQRRRQQLEAQRRRQQEQQRRQQQEAQRRRQQQQQRY